MNLLKRNWNFVGFACIFASIFLLSSCEGEEKVYLGYTIDYEQKSAVISDRELTNYLFTKINTFNSNEHSNTYEEKEAKTKFDNFCSQVETEIKEKKFKVFDGESVKLQLINVLKNVVSERTINFEQTAQRQRYSTLVIEEVAPAGETQKVSAIIEAKLAPYSLKKETTKLNGYEVNTYSVSKKFNSKEERENDYAYLHYKEMEKILDNISNEIPTNVIYTGQLRLNYASMSDFKGETGEKSMIQAQVIHTPKLDKTKMWKSTDAKAPFATLQFTPKATVEMPVFVKYSMKADGNLFAGEVLRYGFGFVVNDNTGKAKYTFLFKDENSFYLWKQDGIEVSNGAVYTRQ